MDRLRWATLIVAGPFFLGALLLAVPMLGNLVGLYTVTGLAECTSSAGTYNHCWLWGKDLAELANGYTIGIFLGGLLNPFLYFQLLAIFLHPLGALAWMAASCALVVAWWRRRKVQRRA
ncbi:hypothetical protein HMPREF9946_01296 [Acetobacteraceae bacterium AT-5844]|nr:hypothetical protein HMPREF9946_01296 [Acetobacteraceae bacterium AT-5844]